MMTGKKELKNQEQLSVEINELRWQLTAANRTISTIREGEIESKDRSREIQDINTTLEDEAAKREAAQEVLQDLNTTLEDEATKREAAQEVLQDLNTRLEDEATKREAAQEALQDLNIKLEEEATKRQVAQQALQDLNLDLENKVVERTCELQDINSILEEEVMERQHAQELLVRANNSLEYQVSKRTQELQDINAALEGEMLERQATQEALEELNIKLEDEATKRQAAQEALEELNIKLEYEATERQAAQEALQDLNIKLEYEATKRQAAQEALQDVNIKLEDEATKRQAAQEALQDVNIKLEDEATKRQTAQEALQDLNIKLEDEATKRQIAQQGLQDINAALEEEMMERQVAQEALVVSRDALLKNEVQLRYYSDELLETNKELTSFANSIAHDFRSPMVNLKGFSRELGASLSEMRQYFRDELVGLPDKVQEKIDEVLDRDVPESLKFIYASVDRLDRMVNALLGLARIDRRELVLQEVEMTALVNQVCQSFRHQIETNNISLAVGALPTIKSNNMAMEQITGNLVDNAIKYLTPGRPGQIAVTCKEEKEGYVFRVEDNGRGVAESDYEKIFQVFRRAGQQDVPGDGMGLAYVRKVVRQLGGRVWCESEMGVGTKMMFTVPKKYA